MTRRKIRFQRVPLHEVPRPGLRDEGSGRNSVIANRLKKNRGRSKRPRGAQDDDHAVGLWMDMDILRKHQTGTPQIVIHDPMASTNNRYLALADFALGNNKIKRRKEQSS